MYNTYMLKNKFFSFILFFVITFSASFIGGLASISLKEPWYSQLIKSNYNPPDWIFAPVWTTLYLMMTLAIWFFWHTKNRDMNTVYIYFIHIIINTTWSIIFFGFHQILLALLNLLIILFFIIWLMKIYYKTTKLSFLLMVPYLLWSSFALLLNTSILYLN